MQWVTRKGVKLDRSACAWLVLRHLDPQAEFLYLEAEPMQEAIAAGAKPFHNVTYAGPGSRTRSSFEDLLAENGLAQSDPALALAAGPIATVQLSHRVPFGFHGNWRQAA
jgi:hypothetical protein